MEIARDAISRLARAAPAASRYNRVLLGLIAPPVAVMLAFTLWQDPLEGDITRVGGFTENNYGWNAPQARFVPPLAARSYDRPYDIVILGDSYSTPTGGGQTDPGAYWPNHVAQRTGLSVTSIPIWEMTIRDLVEHPIFKASPPRLVIVEHVERYFVRNNTVETARWLWPGIDGCPGGEERARRPLLEAPRPLRAAPVPWTRDTAIRFDFGQAVDVIWKSFWRDGLGINITRVLALALDTDALFSSRVSDRILVYDDEFLPARWTNAEIDAALCNLRAAQARVRSNGKTAFAFLAAPNKLSAYADHLADPSHRGISRLSRIYADPHLSQIRVLDRLRAAIRKGERDIYMPNDTHWGTPGHRIVADAVVAFLTRPDPDDIGHIGGSDAGGRATGRACSGHRRPNPGWSSSGDRHNPA